MTDLTDASELKNIGNKHFLSGQYNEAIKFYTKAIELSSLDSPQDKILLSILYSNRAACNLKISAYGAAIEDANTSIDYDETYVKPYYRRGSAFFILGQYDKALSDFTLVYELHPSSTARKKLIACRKAIKQAKFFACMSYDDVEKLDWKSMDPDPNYVGPKCDDGVITMDFVNELSEHFKNQKLIDKKYLYALLFLCKEYFAEQPNLIRIDHPEYNKITVCGDVHGQYYDVLNLFSLNGFPSEDNPYLFNGDFVDRGSFSCEVIILFLALKLALPKHFFLARGNHESKQLHASYGFLGEVEHKYGKEAYELFSEVFNVLPLGHIINNKILVVHGGLFCDDGVTVNDIQGVNRNKEPPISGIMSDILWADPQLLPGRSPSKRGIGYAFGPDITKKFLQENNLELVIRSHEVKENGYEIEHDGKCITIFSAPNYCDTIGNKGAYINITLRKDDEYHLHFETFTHVSHPNIPCMYYAKNSPFEFY